MIKKTLYFGNGAYLSCKNKQLVIKIPDAETKEEQSVKPNIHRTIPIEDIGIVILDNKQITITTTALNSLIKNNCAVVTCDERNMPIGLFLPLESNTLQSERFRIQAEASLPTKKQIWQQTVRQKILNQAALLSLREVECGNLLTWSKDVRSGDPDNYEARAAVYYWANLFPNKKYFVRDRYGESPNSLLNYGYAILRAIIARALVGTGLNVTYGVFHRNKYNAYCLADDIMEPYRPIVDKLVLEIVEYFGYNATIEDKNIKSKFLSIPTFDVKIGNKTHPLEIAAGITAVSVFKYFKGECKQIAYPELIT